MGEGSRRGGGGGGRHVGETGRGVPGGEGSKRGWKGKLELGGRRWKDEKWSIGVDERKEK